MTVMDTDATAPPTPASPDKDWSPRQLAARGRILDAARDLFFRNGFAKVTSDAVVARAAVSKATLYKHFASMNDLFRATVSAEVDRFGYDPDLSFEDVETFRSALTRYASTLLTFLNAPDTISFSLLMLEEARHQPEAASAYFEMAYGQTLAQLTDLFQRAAAQGIIVLPRPASETAETFLGALEGFALLRAQLGMEEVPYPRPDDKARSTVEDFLRLHLPDQGQPGEPFSSQPHHAP